MSEHTSGPWRVEARTDTWNILAGRRCIARAQKKVGAEADARLIASAPALLEALERVVAEVNESPGSVWDSTVIAGARSAIAEARGSQ